MTISASDLFFVASATVDGGDYGTSVLQSGTENNLFPDVMPADRVSGIVQYRQAYASVLSNENDALSNAQVGLLTRPTDALVEMWATYWPGTPSPSFIAERSLERQELFDADTLEEATQTSGSSVYTAMASTAAFEVGDRAFTFTRSGGALGPFVDWRIITAKTSNSVTLSGAAPTTSGQVDVGIYKRSTSGAVRPISALALTTAGASGGATSLTLDRLDVRVITPAVGAGYNPNSSALGATGGRQPLFFIGDRVLVQHVSTPATREFATILRVNHTTGVVTFTAGLTNAYPSGSKVTLPLNTGTLQANVSLAPFSQQTWTRAWSDSPIGAAIAARYSGPVGMINEGATNDRWACVFTNATQFNVLSERLGQIGSGNIATNYLPLNPMTNEPFFTLYASGWGSGWIAGNAIRFNTRAAAAPVWFGRVVSPGTGSGTDQAVAFIRGDIDA